MHGRQAVMAHVARERLAVACGWLLLAAGVTLALAWKSPGALTIPQFWAEDAAVFFRQQWNHDGPRLLTPYAGYLHLLPRLVAWLATGFSPVHAPLIYNLAALLLASASLLYTAVRLDNRPLAVVLLAGVLLAPTNGEVFGTITNSQWFTQFLLLAACFLPGLPARRWVRIAMAGVVLAVALNGPFSTLLMLCHAAALAIAPASRRIAGLRWLHDYLGSLDRWRLGALWVGGLLQLLTLKLTDQPPGVAFSLPLAFDALAGMAQTHTFGSRILPPVVFAAVLVALPVAALWRAPARLRGFMAAAWALALLQIVAGASKPGLMADTLGVGDRYFLLFKPLLWMFVHLALAAIPRIGQYGALAMALAAMLLVGYDQRAHLRRGLLADLGWQQAVRTVPMEPEQVAVIPIHPQPWTLRLPSPSQPVTEGVADHALAHLQQGLARLPSSVAASAGAVMGQMAESPFVDNHARAISLPPGATAHLRWQAPRPGEVVAASVFIGNYGNSANGDLAIEVCSNGTCRRSQGRLAGSRDNRHFRVDFRQSLPLAAGAPLSIRISSIDATRPFAFWAYPASGDAPRIETLPGADAADLRQRTLRFGLIYRE